MANYSPDQVVYPGDLRQFDTKWWSGGLQFSDFTNQPQMLREGYRFLPAFNTGYVLRTDGFASDVPASTPKQSDPHSCIDTPCALNTSAMLAEVRGVQSSIGTDGNYYSIGNEVDDSFSDDVSPSVFGGQFDAWVSAIKQGDPTAKIVAPSISSVSCCDSTVSQPWGTAGQWFASFVADYEQQHDGDKPPIDVLAMHLYNQDLRWDTASATRVDDYVDEVQNFREEADRLGYAGVPIWITELGFLYPPGGPLTAAQSGQITNELRALAANAPRLDLQRVFLFTDNQQTTIADGLNPLFDPNVGSSPSTSMPLTDYGRLVADVTGGGDGS